MKHYVITIMDNENSVSSAKRTIKSGHQFGHRTEHWEATIPKDNPRKIMEEKGIDPAGFEERSGRVMKTVWRHSYLIILSGKDVHLRMKTFLF